MRTRPSGPVADGSRGQQGEGQNLEIRPPTPRPQNSEIWPPTAPRPLNSDSSCPFHQNSTRGEVGGPKSDRFAAISGFGPCRIPKFCPRIRGGRIYMRTSSSPSETDPYVYICMCASIEQSGSEPSAVVVLEQATETVAGPLQAMPWGGPFAGHGAAWGGGCMGWGGS